MRSSVPFLGLVPLVLFTAACGSGSSIAATGDDPRGGDGAAGAGAHEPGGKEPGGDEPGGAGGAESTGKKPAAGAGGQGGDETPIDAAPGELEDLELAIDGGNYSFSWAWPADDDLADLRFAVLTAAQPAPELEDAESIGLDADEVSISGLSSGTDYVAYFFLVDEAGNVTLTTLSFASAGPAPVENVFGLALRDAIFLRWTNPPQGFESVVVRQAQGTLPASVMEGEEVFAGLGERALIDSLNKDFEYGHLLYALDAEGQPSDFRTLTIQPNADHAVVVDAASECGGYGYRLGQTPWTQTFVRGTAGEDVLTGFEVQIGRTGNPTDKLRVRLLDENDDYLWSNTILAANIPAGTSWILVSADGKGATKVPYRLLEEGKEYKIELSVLEWGGSDADYFTWMSSTGETDCYDGGQGMTAEKDFQFRTIHATAE